MATRLSLSLILSFATLMPVACSNSDFAGGSAKKSEENSDENADDVADDANDNAGDENKSDTATDAADSDDDIDGDAAGVEAGDVTTDGDIAEDDFVIDGDGARIVKPKFDECLKIKESGKVRYTSTPQCPDNQVMVMIDDGPNVGKGDMTCCPVAKAVLTSDTTKRHVERPGLCNDNEVQTGVKQALGGAEVSLCTAINTKQLKLEAAGTAIEMTKNTPGISADLKAILTAWVEGDGCVCAEGTFMLGGRNTQSGCTTPCGKLTKK